MFQLMNREYAHAGLPQSEFRKLEAAVQRGASIVLKVRTYNHEGIMTY
jgi:hypothetical protein